ncbi:serine hydroxymethyltransferase [Hwanghaeella sp.]|uniref:serine hydroxymethyltransferase n=1 Tax=Hwanghaeella sp. TaxID=2605943 RepID=UPI003CCB99D3
MTRLTRRGWVPAETEDFVIAVASEAAVLDADAQEAEIDRLVAWNRDIHDRDCINLNPATNVMNPKAEAVLSSGIGSRPSLGYPGDKYEMGLEAIERIEVIAAEIAAEVFNAGFAEIRVASGALSNLYAFMATCAPGDDIIVPAAVIGGHVTHHAPGAAGLYGLNIHAAPVDPARYTVDLDALGRLARQVRPKLITIGGSLNLHPHPVAEIRAICDEVGAYLLFDAAHLCGMIAGKAWPNPLDEGAHLMTMSTYKSLGGPAGGLIVTNDAVLAERLDKIAFPGLTANFDAAKSAALALSLLDWKQFGEAYAETMVDTAAALAAALQKRGLPVFTAGNQATASHQFAIEAAAFGGGQAAAKKLRQANILTCGIGLPIDPVPGDMNGLRFGTPEIVRWGMTVADMDPLADLIKRGLEDPAATVDDATAFRHRFQDLHYIRK